MHRTRCRWALALILASALVGPNAIAQQATAPAFKDTTVMPEGQKGARVRSLIEVINSGEPGRIKGFLDNECTAEFRATVPIEEHISVALGFLRDTGGIEFYSVRTYTPERPDSTVVVVKDRNLGSWWGLGLRFGESPKFLVAGLGFSPARPPAGAPNRR